MSKVRPIVHEICPARPQRRIAYVRGAETTLEVKIGVLSKDQDIQESRLVVGQYVASLGETENKLTSSQAERSPIPLAG